MTEDVRISDVDRQQVVGRLREETTAGRLTLDEFDERLSEAYAAKTRSELAVVLRELPQSPSVPVEPALPATVDGDLPPALEAKARRRWRHKLRNDASRFVATNGICITIWTMAGADGSFWPGWVLAFTGIGIVKTLIGGIDEQRDLVEKQWRKQQKELTEKTA